MRNLTLLFLVGVMSLGSSVMGAAVAIEDLSSQHIKKADARPTDVASSATDGYAIVEEGVQTVAPDTVIYTLDPGLPFRHVVVGADGSVTENDDEVEGGVAGPGERLIYSNTLGINAVAIGNGLLLSDDITTTAPVGCNLSRFRFKVLGKVNPGGVGGAYTVRYALYNVCPQSVPSAMRTRDVGHPSGGIRLPGTSGELTFPDDAPRTIEHVINLPNITELPTNLWLGVSFLRSNCGLVVGAPAMVGHSADNWDQGGATACSGFLGGFPEQPHASIWAEVFGGANCPDTFVAYRAARASGTQFSANGNRWFMDDVKLNVTNCQLVGYEVAVRNQGFYEFELRRDCNGDPIPGTYRTYSLNLSTQPQLQLARFSFNPPIPLNTQDLFFAFKVNNTTAGVVLAGVQPTIGTTSENYFITADDNTCTVIPPAPGSPITGAFHASITCGGALPVGACCDPYLTQCFGGTDNGNRCRCNAVCVGGVNDGNCCSPSSPCASPGVCTPVCGGGGTCEAVCRQVAQMNCPFPPRGQDLIPKWVQGAACTPDPFGGTPCGEAACCHMQLNPQTQLLDEVCTNQTKNGCDAQVPLDKARLWQLGLRCGFGPQSCPRNACIARTGSCTVIHATPGCSDPFCCSDVCTLFGVDGAFCCDVEWDDLCVAFAEKACSVPPGNDGCAPDGRRIDGATLIPVPGSAATNVDLATNDASEPGFCCHGGTGTCIGGSQTGKPCVIATDCPSGTCTPPTPTPGEKGMGIVWFKFVQPAGQTTARVHTCSSNSPARDSILQVYKVGDNSSLINACRSLIPIACNDDAPGGACGFDGRNSSVCVTNLVPGETYYISVSAKTEQTKGEYRVTVQAGCSGGDVRPNDYCPNATPVSNGVTPFNLASATFDCPAEVCVPQSRNDLWYNYTATCTGQARIETCGPTSGTSPDTNLVVYEDCTKCPPNSGAPVGCNADAFLNCGFGSRVIVNVTQGQCYKIRVADNQGFAVSGNLTITCLGNDCNNNGIADNIDIANCPVNNPDCKDCNGNGVLDFCDIRDGVEQDCDLNGVPDSCQPDCQPNGVPDACDIANCPPGDNGCKDCNNNNIPDSCDIANCPTADPSCKDVNANGIPDGCESPACPNGTMTFVNPPSGAVDARIPYVANQPTQLRGFTTFTVTGPTGASATACWSMCERNQSIGPNSISSVVEGPAGTYTVTLARPITMNSTTTITYTPGAGAPSTGVFKSHPANADGGAAANPTDILELLDHLNGTRVPPLAIYQCDMDRSNLCAPGDILTLIDLLNGGSGWPVQNATQLPPSTCP